MSGIEEEPKTVRIKSKQPSEEKYDEHGFPIEGEQPVAVSGPTLNDQDLFKGLKAMLPFFLELEVPQDRSHGLSLLCSDESPPFITSVRESAKGGERALQSQRRAASLRETEIPFCGLLGCYQPSTTTVVIYNQGINWVLSAFEQDFRAVVPPHLSNRPLRELYIPDPDQANRAYRIYLRWLLRAITMIHELSHALVHLAHEEEAQWTTPQGFESIPVKVHEHLAQSIVATALEVREITAPFPPSDLACVFHRLSLNLPLHCRAWAFSLPWGSKEELAVTLRSLRFGQLPLGAAAL